MTCEEIRERLPQLVDSDLLDWDLLEWDGPAEERRLWEEHVSECEVCRQSLDSWKALREEARSLSTEMLPERDLWSGIAQEISREAAPGEGLETSWLSRRWLSQQLHPVRLGLLAAGLMVLVSVLSLVWWAAHYEATDHPKATASSTPSAGSRAADLARYEDRVLPTRKELLAVVAAREAELVPEIASAIVDDVRALNDAIGQIRLALEEHPDNRRLNLVLAAKYQQEVALLHRLRAI